MPTKAFSRSRGHVQASSILYVAGGITHSALRRFILTLHSRRMVSLVQDLAAGPSLDVALKHNDRAFGARIWRRSFPSAPQWKLLHSRRFASMVRSGRSCMAHGRRLELRAQGERPISCVLQASNMYVIARISPNFEPCYAL